MASEILLDSPQNSLPAGIPEYIDDQIDDHIDNIDGDVSILFKLWNASLIERYRKSLPARIPEYIDHIDSHIDDKLLLFFEIT